MPATADRGAGTAGEVAARCSTPGARGVPFALGVDVPLERIGEAATFA